MGFQNFLSPFPSPTQLNGQFCPLPFSLLSPVWVPGARRRCLESRRRPPWARPRGWAPLRRATADPQGRCCPELALPAPSPGHGALPARRPELASHRWSRENLSRPMDGGHGAHGRSCRSSVAPTGDRRERSRRSSAVRHRLPELRRWPRRRLEPPSSPSSPWGERRPGMGMSGGDRPRLAPATGESVGRPRESEEAASAGRPPASAGGDSFGRLKMTQKGGPTRKWWRRKEVGIRTGQNRPFTWVGDGKGKRKPRNHEKG